jgi:hypothetical protein
MDLVTSLRNRAMAVDIFDSINGGEGCIFQNNVLYMSYSCWFRLFSPLLVGPGSYDSDPLGNFLLAAGYPITSCDTNFVRRIGDDLWYKSFMNTMLNNANVANYAVCDQVPSDCSTTEGSSYSVPIGFSKIGVNYKRNWNLMKVFVWDAWPC